MGEDLVMDKFNFFRGIIGSIIESDSKIVEFSSLFTMKKYNKNSYYIYELDNNSTIGFLNEGYMRSFITDYEGNEAIIRFVKPGEIISGGFAFDFPSPVSIQSISESIIYQTNWKTLSAYIQKNKEYLKILNQFLSNGSFNTTRMLAGFIRLDAKERYLLFKQEYPGAIDKIPHYFIANYLGISAVQLSRIRKNFVD